MKVRATRPGFYGGVHRPAGDVFELAANAGMSVSHQFSWKWMERVDDKTPVTVRQEQQDAEEGTKPTGDEEVI